MNEYNVYEVKIEGHTDQETYRYDTDHTDTYRLKACCEIVYKIYAPTERAAWVIALRRAYTDDIPNAMIV